MITQEKLKEVLHYNPDTGIFTWLVQRGSNTKLGMQAGYIDNGYIKIGIDYKYYKAHRLAFLYMTGKFPEDQVDHIDTIRHHNWFSNLRKATNRQNQENQRKAHKDNKSTGILGVYPNRSGGFISQISINNKLKHLGSFRTIEEAHDAYINAKRKLHEFNTL